MFSGKVFGTNYNTCYMLINISVLRIAMVKNHLNSPWRKWTIWLDKNDETAAITLKAEHYTTNWAHNSFTQQQ